MSETDWEDLLTRPLSEAELKGYMAELKGPEFQQLVHDYHAQAALTASRNAILELLQQSYPPEVVLVVIAHLWLDSLVRLSPDFSREMVQGWRNMPDTLAQVMLQHAVVVLTEYKDTLVQTETPELEDMFGLWRKALSVPVPALAREAEALQEATQRVYQSCRHFQEKLENGSGLKLVPVDFCSIWCRLLLQLFIFMQSDDHPDFYYLLDQNWSTFLPTLQLLVDMMMVFQGMEHVLLPENRSELLRLLQQPDIAPYFSQYLEA
ncbi:MAG: hypothetical protein ACO1RX_21630 [Candidatus Sericytochromatia bacterium]